MAPLGTLPQRRNGGELSTGNLEGDQSADAVENNKVIQRRDGGQLSTGDLEGDRSADALENNNVIQ